MNDRRKIKEMTMKRNILSFCKGLLRVAAFLPALLLFAALAGCNEQLKDWNDLSRLTRVQYYGISETFPYYTKFNGAASGANIFVDTLNISGYSLPSLSFSGKQSWYPAVNSNAAGNQPYYMNYPAGTHRFLFIYMGWGNDPSVTSPNIPLSRLADASFNLEAGKYYTLYFTDDVAQEGAVAAYRVVKVEDLREKSVAQGKVSVHFLHLSPDAGKVRITQLMKDGSEQDVSTQLSFTEVTDYFTFDTSQAQNGLLLFNIYAAGSNTALVAGVPATAGHSFDILLHGFVQTHQRQVVTGCTSDYKPVYTTVTLPLSFDTTVRQMY